MQRFIFMRHPPLLFMRHPPVSLPGRLSGALLFLARVGSVDDDFDAGGISGILMELLCDVAHDRIAPLPAASGASVYLPP